MRFCHSPNIDTVGSKLIKYIYISHQLQKHLTIIGNHLLNQIDFTWIIEYYMKMSVQWVLRGLFARLSLLFVFSAVLWYMYNSYCPFCRRQILIELPSNILLHRKRLLQERQYARGSGVKRHAMLMSISSRK